MKIKTVKYEALETLGNYSNVKIGAEAVVEEGEKPEDALIDLEQFVAQQLQYRTARQTELASVTRQVDEQRMMFNRHAHAADKAKKQYDRIRKLLTPHGVELPAIESVDYYDESDPFADE